jgi:hypothetical protein
MYKTISNEIIRKFQPCYDPSKYITDENEELTIKEWVQKYRKVIPDQDIVWLLVRKEFLSEIDLILFVIWCARELLKSIENPDEIIVNACNVAERYANGKATKEELHIAYDAAFNAKIYAPDAALNDEVSASNTAYYVSADAATYATDDYVSAFNYEVSAFNAANASAAYSAAVEAAYYISVYASDAADYATANYYAIKAAYFAACGADVAYAAQVDKLLTYFE